MRDNLNAIGIANRVMMCRGNDRNQSIVVVEGDDDAKLYRTLTHKERCRLQPAYGKPMVQDTMSILSQRRAPGVVAILDADFQRLHDSIETSPGFIYTEHHDAEVMLLASPALEQVLGEFVSEGVTAALVRQQLFELARIPGQYRLASHRHEWKLRFSELPFERFVDIRTMKLDLDNFVDVLRGHQGGRTSLPLPSADEMAVAVTNIASSRYSDLQLCNGHDLQQLLALGLRQCWGKNKPSDVTVPRLASYLRVAYHCTYFEMTSMFTDMVMWQRANAPYVVVDATEAG